MTVELITNSRLTLLQHCRRAHHNRYVMGYVPLQRSRPLDFGTVGHLALERWWKAYQDNRSDNALADALGTIEEAKADDFEKARLQVLLSGYDVQWAGAMADYDVIGVELEFRYPSGRGYDLAGKMDLVLNHRPTQRVLIGEHKFPGSDLSPTSWYWEGLMMAPQVSQYFRGAKSLGLNPAGCLWDAIRRIDVKPYTATPAKKRKFTKAGKLYANQREADETVAEFRDRIAALVSEDPREWYARREVVRFPEELEEFDRDVEAWADLALSDAKADHVPRSPGACHRYGRPCEYLGPCRRTASLNDPGLFERVYDVHQELKGSP